MSAACRVLGICRRSFYRHWVDTFTPYATEGGHRRIASDELAEAAKYPESKKARGAVKLLRKMLGRITCGP